jgi:uncharacterized protein
MHKSLFRAAVWAKVLGAAFAAFAAGLAWTKDANTQSFNCNHARHTDERTICREPALRQLDQELASVYRRLIIRLSKSGREQLDREEEKFVVARRRCGNRTACIEQSYRKRIQELEEMLGGTKR